MRKPRTIRVKTRVQKIRMRRAKRLCLLMMKSNQQQEEQSESQSNTELYKAA